MLHRARRCRSKVRRTVPKAFWQTWRRRVLLRSRQKQRDFQKAVRHVPILLFSYQVESFVPQDWLTISDASPRRMLQYDSIVFPGRQYARYAAEVTSSPSKPPFVRQSCSTWAKLSIPGAQMLLRAAFIRASGGILSTCPSYIVMGHTVSYCLTSS